METKTKQKAKAVRASVTHLSPYMKKFKYLQKEKRIRTERKIIKVFFIACVLNSRSHDPGVLIIIANSKQERRINEIINF